MIQRSRSKTQDPKKLHPTKQYLTTKQDTTIRSKDRDPKPKIKKKQNRKTRSKQNNIHK